MTTLIFSPLSSTSSFFRNPNSTFFVRDFSTISISISNNRKNNLISGGSFRVSARATALPLLDAETNRPDASGRSIHLEISKLGISEEIVSALSRRGITELFPIQRAVLDPAMEGRDMIGRAITGSGKTLAFAIPILEKIIRHRRPQRQKRIPSALVLAPTRELARQVQKEFKESAPNLSSVCLYGGVPITNQVRVLGFGIDIAVGTPGRIIDLVERGALNLSEVKFVVLDEADQMLAVGFQEDVENILNYLPAKKQCMLFSATMPSWVNELSRKYLRDPLVVDLVGDSDQKLADGISLYSVVSTASGKESILPTLISKYGRGGKSIIFTKTKKDAEDLSRSMGSMLASRALHGNMQQFQRDKTLAAFRDGRFSVLVATDVAARGLDIPNVDLVIHFEIPNSSEIFVHRSGRTGRAGNKGTAVLIYTKAQSRNIRLIERDLGFRFEELPRITDGIANVTRSTTPDRSIYGRYDDSDHFSENRFGSSREFTYDNVSKTKNQYEGRFGDYDSSRKNPNSRNSSLRTTRFAKSRISQLNDFKKNHMMEKKSVEGRKPNDFKEILDMLKDMS